MFECEECANKYYEIPLLYSTSFGPCESCGKTRVCYDVRPHWKRKCTHADDEKRRKERDGA